MRKLAEQADLTWQALKGSPNLLTQAGTVPDETEANRIANGMDNIVAKGQALPGVDKAVSTSPRWPVHLSHVQ